jgi:hypothetical protein
MAAQKAKRIAEQNRKRKVLRGHVLPWAVWQERLPSMQSLNRQDVRIIALAAKGVFQHATASTSYVSALDVFRLRRAAEVAGDIENAAVSTSSGVDQEDVWLAAWTRTERYGRKMLQGQILLLKSREFWPP